MSASLNVLLADTGTSHAMDMPGPPMTPVCALGQPIHMHIPPPVPDYVPNPAPDHAPGAPIPEPGPDPVPPEVIEPPLPIDVPPVREPDQPMPIQGRACRTD